ncbi:MAG TPA: hypothetical protein VFD58_01205 [Blastocatellia bacterium]|nr:hypothetical protein [Blastocatellia bacterium]
MSYSRSKQLFGQPLAYGYDQAAQATGLGTTFIKNAILNGELKARIAGDRVLILRCDLEAWLEALPLKPLRNGEADLSKDEPSERKAAK